MKRFLLFAVALLLLAATAQAQEGKSTTRIQKQHNYNIRWMSQRLKQTEESLVKALQDSSVGMQTTAAQTLRELVEIFPEYPFSISLAPLEKKLRDEDSDPVVRRLAALALDGLHSDAGDAVLRATADSSKDKGLGILCKALLVKSSNK